MKEREELMAMATSIKLHADTLMKRVRNLYPDKDKEWYDTVSAGEYLDKSPKTIVNGISVGKFPSAKKRGNKWKINVRDLKKEKSKT